ncbi:MAG: hypothetical protein JWP69_522 [Flaviaesturariibacter sp.]|nr:hypothetical protein [Flaviaesturariibacter sp.]
MAKKNVRIPIPKNAEDLMKLARQVHTKHQELGDASPLRAMEDYSWTTAATDLAKAEEAHKRAEQLDKEAEKLRGERNALLQGTIKGIVTSSRNMLQGAYAKNLKKMGDFGFTVDDSPKPKVEAKPAL